MYGQTWHLPVDNRRPTYRQFVAMASKALGRDAGYTVVPKWILSAAGRFSAEAREIKELLRRYKHDNHFDSTKFTERFPEFKVTTYRDGLDIIREEASLS